MAQLPPRYENPRPIGPDPLGERFSAFDRERGLDVHVVKAAPQPGKDPRAAGATLEWTYWALAGCPHEALVGVLDFAIATDGRPFYTQPAPGPTLEGPVSEADVKAWLPGLVTGLAALHEQGYVHGCLAPTRLHRRPDGTVALAVPAPVPAGVPGSPRGDIPWVSPEGARREPLDGRADWYGLGAVLFQLLAGRPPRTGDEAPLRLRQVVPTASRVFDEALLRLLASEPDERPDDAAAVLAAFGLVAGLGERTALLVSPIIGRKPEIEAIARLIEGEGPPSLWLAGQAGTGKSRLLDEARGRARLKGLETFRARGLGSDAPPYEALLPWVRALVARAPALDEGVAATLATVLPELAAGRPAPAAGEAGQSRLRLHGTVAELARAVAPAALWLLDDADRLDPASGALLSALRRARGEQRWRWLLAGRSAQVVRPELGEAADPSIELAPLAATDVVAIARKTLGSHGLPVGLSERLPTLSEGLPARIGPLLRHWIASGDLARDAGRWIAAPGASFLPPAEWEMPPDQALKALAPALRAVARTAAVLGERARLDWLQANVGVGGEDFFAALATLEGKEILARDGSYVRFRRPGHAAAIVASIPATERKRLLGTAARRIEQALAPRPDDPALPLADLLALAKLHLQGDEPGRGVPWALHGARRALAVHAPAQAEALASAALALPEPTPAERLALNLALVDALRNLGRAPEAFSRFEGEVMPALRVAPPPDMARHVITLGVLHQAGGRYAQARALFTEAIALADKAELTHEAVRARIFAGRLAFFEGHGDQALAHFHDAAGVARAAGSRADLGWALALYGHMLGTLDPAQIDRGLALLDEAQKIQAADGNHVRLFEAHNDRGNLLLAAGRFAEARETFDRALNVGAVVGPQEAIFAHLNLAYAALELGEPVAARTGAAEVTELAQRMGTRLPESFGAAVEGLALVRCGQPAVGWARLERALALAGELSNRYAELAAGALAVEALVELGRWEAARAALGRMRDLAAAAKNHEHDSRFARLEATLDVLQGRPEAGQRVAALLEAARARGSEAEIALAMALQAAWLLAAGGDETAFANAVQNAEAHAVKGGLASLPGELAIMHGERMLRNGQAMFAGLTLLRALGVAEKLELVPLELRAAAALGEADASHAARAEQARTRYRAMIAGLAPAEAEAYARLPGNQRLAR